ncbi:MAG: glycosyltransferase family 2 protein [Patescibacteria group bacterium]|jgi:GT2 family glycosyltransferase
MKLVVGFIVYNEDSAKYLADFWPSMRKSLQFLSPAEYSILVFDNSIGGYKKNRDFFANQPVKYFTRDENIGFSRAYNILLGEADLFGAEYFLMINPDTFLEPDSIRKLVEAMDKDTNFASASPKILHWDFGNHQKDKIIDSCGLILKPGLSFEDLGQGSEDRGQFNDSNILGPSGAAGLFRLNAVKEVAEFRGLMDRAQYLDERFFMYKEDCDLAYRLFLAGYKSIFVPDSVIYHDRTAVSSGSGFWAKASGRFRKSRQIRRWSHLNQHYIYLKYWSRQSLSNKVFIGSKILFFLIFSLILEQFNLKNYLLIFKNSRG